MPLTTAEIQHEKPFDLDEWFEAVELGYLADRAETEEAQAAARQFDSMMARVMADHSARVEVMEQERWKS
jgi:hypothetical protein